MKSFKKFVNNTLDKHLVSKDWHHTMITKHGPHAYASHVNKKGNEALKKGALKKLKGHSDHNVQTAYKLISKK